MRPQIALYQNRDAHVLFDQRPQGLVALAAFEQFQRRNAQPFLIALGRIRRVGPGDATADIGVVTNRGGKGEPLALVIKQLEDEGCR